MPISPSLEDRVLKRAVPTPVAAYTPLPWELCEGLWLLERQLLHFGSAILPTRSSILRLGDGSVVVVSPPPLLESGSAAAIDAIGPVESVVIPNPFHYMYTSEFTGRYPSASVLAAPGLVQRVPELDFALELGAQPPTTWSGELEYVVLGPVRGLSEALLFHVSTGTLILTDLAFNMLRYPRRIDRLIWRLSGVPGGLGPGRTSRSLLLRDRNLASRALARALEWPIRRIVVAHGEVVERDAKAQFRKAFARYLDGVPEA